MATPKLRFKEFDNDWINTKVKDLGEFSSGGTPSKDIHDYWNGNIPWISSSDLNEESIFDIRINRFISEDAIKNSATKKIPKNSILLVSRVGVGKVALTNQELCTSQDFTALTPKKDYALFIAYLMKNITPRLLDLNQGTSIKGFVREDLISLPISLPSKEEQTKIASFLSAVDEKISQLSQKLHLLGQYKQGMMQKLFSQQIRFKADDDREFMEWEEKELKNVVEINPKAKKLPENFIYIDLESVEKGRLLLQKNIALQDAPSRAQRLLAKGDVLFQMVRPYQQNNYYFNLSGEYVASTGYAQIRTKLDSKFIYYALHEKTFLDEVMNRCTGTSYPAINSSDLSSIEILIPCLEEQTKIANFLSAIDQKIDVVSEQLEQAKLWKKGLLQQMFV